MRCPTYFFGGGFTVRARCSYVSIQRRGVTMTIDDRSVTCALPIPRLLRTENREAVCSRYMYTQMDFIVQPLASASEALALPELSFTYEIVIRDLGVGYPYLPSVTEVIATTLKGLIKIKITLLMRQKVNVVSELEKRS
ncbi:hypothetical protein KQX54_007078 [Cotesia glomerata]|uniref:Uncharacterized protein n=1 Tax=Cotesia glomerata TaxID=32391 RepID=A0AAV7HYY2_COTGL|nr:hypothetical protein KQX54_007078 [Cotesia glomerata]